MKKVILILILGILLISLVSAKLSEDQLNEAISKVLEKAPNCKDIEGVRNFIISQDCDPQVIQGSTTFSCGDDIIHEYECRFGIHYLDKGVISILSQKTDISDSNININSPNTQQTIDKSETNFNFKIAFSISLIGNLIEIGFIIYLWKKKPKAKQKTKKENKPN